MNSYFYYFLISLILLPTLCTYTYLTSQVVTFKQFYTRLQHNNPTLANKIYLYTKQHRRKQQTHDKLVAFLRKSAAIKKILQKHSLVIEAVYEDETVYGDSTISYNPHAYTLKVYSNYYRPGVFTLTDQDAYGTLEIQKFSSHPDKTIIAPSGEAWMNLCDPANVLLFDHFKEKASNDDVITFACRNPYYLKDSVIQKRVIPIIPTLSEHLLTQLMQKIDDTTLCSLLSSTENTALIKRTPVLKRCSTKQFYLNLDKVSDYIAYQILLANLKDKFALTTIIDNKRSLLAYKDVLDRVLQEPYDNDFILMFINCATAEIFAKAVFARPNLWDDALIKKRILQLDNWAASLTKPYGGNPHYFNTLFWLGNYVRLDTETTAAAKKFLSERELKLPLITRNFNRVEQWITQSHINYLFDILEKKEYPGTALRFSMPSSASSCTVELNDTTHNALETIGRLATDLNQAGKQAHAANMLKAFMFLRGSTLEGMNIAFEMLKFYPIYFAVGNLTATLANPDTAAMLGVCLMIYNTYCTSADLKTQFCSMLQAVQNNDFESAGRHAARIGINLVTFKHVFNVIKGLATKFIFGVPNTSVCQAVEEQIKNNKQEPKAANSKSASLSLGDINSQINALPDIVNKKEFAEAFERFHKLPGALTKDCPFTKILECGNDPSKIGNVKGAWYEIKKALELLKQGEAIESLSVVYKSSRGKAEFDIQTTSKLIECKNIKWVEYENIKELSKIIQEKVTKLCSDIKRHTLVAKEIGKKYELHSHNQIPEVWKKWFTQNEIRYFEDFK